MPMDHTSAVRLAYKATQLTDRNGRPQGRRVGAARYELDCAGTCQSPVTIEHHARPCTDRVSSPIIRAVRRAYPQARVRRKRRRSVVIDTKAGTLYPINVVLHAPCRACAACLGRRKRMWMQRAQTEYDSAVRTWFGTLTISPDKQFAALAQARAIIARERDFVGPDAPGPASFDALSEREQFALHAAQYSDEITRYVKRLRKESGAAIRYLIVCEAHKTGWPHFHALVHECRLGQPITKRTLEGQWKLGFASWKLVDRDGASYVCKYLNKDARSRMRASLEYGNPPSASGMEEHEKLQPLSASGTEGVSYPIHSR